MKQVTIDANTAVSNIAYLFSDVIPVYPITPSSSMSELSEQRSAQGERNLFGNTPIVSQLQSEAGSAGALHGAATTGALATTFTCSQGLLLMIPTLYKLAGEQLPCVIHVSARAVATHALSIFGDHSDVMACRQTGAVILASSGVQNAADMAIVAHLVATKLSLPVLHFFDGFRTSHEINKIFIPEKAELEQMLQATNFPTEIEKFRSRALNPDHPLQRGTAQNEDVFFQNREAVNPLYESAETIIRDVMDCVGKFLGRPLRIVEYTGSPTANYVAASIGSSAEVIQETLEHENDVACGGINLHLYRPFPTKSFLDAIPDTCTRLSALDRTKEAGCIGEPLYLDICAAIHVSKRGINVFGGRYGLGGKDFTPACVEAVYQNMKNATPLHPFTVGISDNVTHISLPLPQVYNAPKEQFSCKFYGYGSDGTVGAVKRLATTIGNNTKTFVQAFFQYDSKKSGGTTLSHLRFSDTQIHSAYAVGEANFIACTRPSFFVDYNIENELKAGGTLLINAADEATAQSLFSDKAIRLLEKKAATVYAINADSLAEKCGLTGKLSTIFQVAFLHFFAPENQKERLVTFIKQDVEKVFFKKGKEVVQRNIALINDVEKAIFPVHIHSTKQETHSQNHPSAPQPDIADKLTAILLRKGNDLPVSAFSRDGSVPTDTAKQELRTPPSHIPKWNEQNCIQCAACAFYCPHAAIRCTLLPSDTDTPKSYRTIQATQAPNHRFHIQIYPTDCTGCGVCINVCPVNQKEQKMAKQEQRSLRKASCALISETSHAYAAEECSNQSFNATLPPPNQEIYQHMSAMKRVCFRPTMFEASAACAGCGETPYLKILTALLGERLIIANATGCSSIYGASYPLCPYAKNTDGKGTAWANSLFENNAEFAYGMRLSYDARRNALKDDLSAFFTNSKTGTPSVYTQWLEQDNNPSVANALYDYLCQLPKHPALDSILQRRDCFCEKSIWCVGGDGWAYDIGFGGIDHLLSSNVNVKILVLDTECYSNTGGQQSKATPLGASVKLALLGKKMPKKSLAKMMSVYKHAYIAQCSLGANGAQFVKAIEEAEAHTGPALIVCFSPCISHGYNLSDAPAHQKAATESGYFPLFRYKNGEFIQDSTITKTNLSDFFESELRFLPRLEKEKK